MFTKNLSDPLPGRRGVDPAAIAVYCDLKFDSRLPPPATFNLFSGGDSDYDRFSAGNFRHVVFNLGLQEGWDDPECGFAYIDKDMGSPDQITQVVGRVLRRAADHIREQARKIVDAYVEHSTIVQNALDHPYVVSSIAVDESKLVCFRNALHEGYSDLNAFERSFAEAIDRTRRVWCSLHLRRTRRRSTPPRPNMSQRWPNPPSLPLRRSVVAISRRSLHRASLSRRQPPPYHQPTRPTIG
jgi:hypothetical protein